jgi:hypothetical protein
MKWSEETVKIWRSNIQACKQNTKTKTKRRSWENWKVDLIRKKSDRGAELWNLTDLVIWLGSERRRKEKKEEERESEEHGGGGDGGSPREKK